MKMNSLKIHVPREGMAPVKARHAYMAPMRRYNARQCNTR